MTTVRPAPPEHFEWLAFRAQLCIGSQFRAMEAVDESGRILGMVGFDGWTNTACMVHIALESPAVLRRLLRPAFGLLFDAPSDSPAGCGRVVVNATVLSTNARSLALVKHLGFRQTHRIVDGWDHGVDIVMFEMRRHECRWVRQPAVRKVG